jgi:hypothetical protein
MWRIIFLGALGLILGSRAHSEKQIVLLSMLFGLLYGGAEVLTIATIQGPLSLSRALFLLGLGLVMAAPVYAVAEIWRRTRVQAVNWVRRLFR